LFWRFFLYQQGILPLHSVNVAPAREPLRQSVISKSAAADEPSKLDPLERFVLSASSLIDFFALVFYDWYFDRIFDDEA
jgi:hypothetical protein